MLKVALVSGVDIYSWESQNMILLTYVWEYAKLSIAFLATLLKAQCRLDAFYLNTGQNNKNPGGNLEAQAYEIGIHSPIILEHRCWGAHSYLRHYLSGFTVPIKKQALLYNTSWTSAVPRWRSETCLLGREESCKATSYPKFQSAPSGRCTKLLRIIAFSSAPQARVLPRFASRVLRSTFLEPFLCTRLTSAYE